VDATPDLSTQRRRRALVPALVLALLVAAIGLATLAGPWLDEESAPAALPVTTTIPATTTTAVPQPQVPVETWLATPKGEVATFAGPGGAEIGTVGFWFGYPMTMPIIAQQDEWMQIRLPERPNGSTAWVRAQDIGISTTPYRIVVDVTRTNVTLFKDGFPQFTIPAGVGKASTPTPTGNFFVAVIEDLGSSGYGPVVLDTSGHSEAIQSWEGSGDAIVALHGPISSSSDARIGTTGTFISNGCIRLHRADQLRLADVPLGTPVDIVA
jgi:lipoprotein-anchoring transpeptidase ErfK/SrfK